MINHVITWELLLNVTSTLCLCLIAHAKQSLLFRTFLSLTKDILTLCYYIFTEHRLHACSVKDAISKHIINTFTWQCHLNHTDRLLHHTAVITILTKMLIDFSLPWSCGTVVPWPAGCAWPPHRDPPAQPPDAESCAPVGHWSCWVWTSWQSPHPLDCQLWLQRRSEQAGSLGFYVLVSAPTLSPGKRERLLNNEEAQTAVDGKKYTSVIS